MKLRLQSRYLLTIISLVMLVVVSLSVLLMWQFHQSTDRIRDLSAESLKVKLEDELRDRGRVVSGFLAADIATPLAALDMAEMYRLIRATRELGDVEYVFVYDNDGRVIHDGTVEIAGYGAAVGDLSASMLAGGADVIEFDTPVSLIDDRLGGVRLGLTTVPIVEETIATERAMTALIDQGKRNNWFNVAGTTGLFLLLSMLVALFIARGLVLPIRRLAAYAAQVGQGNYEAPLSITRTDELGDLARSLQEMSENLQVTTGEVHYLAYHDSLTRLPNRAQLKQALRQAIARGKRNDHSVALLFIDLDDFKRVNDTLGHEAGDTLLKEFAVRLRDCLRDGDQLTPDNADDTPNELIARLGGDEFTVVLENIRESTDAGLVATRILSLLKEPYVLGGQEVVIGGSIGVTTFPEDGSDVDTLLRNADVAMYQAKERGKNNFEFYNDSMHRMATERLSLETDLRHAIEYDQMRLLYQPLLDAKTSELRGIEAQVRWIHPALGGILPAVFMPLAEQTGYIVELDEWAINRACEDLAQLNALGYRGFPIGINLASVHFRDHSLSGSLLQALDRHNLDPRRIVLEINEKTIMRNFARASTVLSELQQRGVRVFMDEFGSGHSPLNSLTKMPVDGLKIARDYVGQMTDGEHEKAIISTIVAMAHSLNLSVCAEGVENTQQIELLREIQCDVVQGSLFARPMLLADLVTYLEKNSQDKSRLSTGTFSMVPLPNPGGRS